LITVTFSIIKASAKRGIIANFDMRTVQGVNETRIVQIEFASSNILGQFSQERLLITVIFSIIEASARKGIIANFDMRTVQGVDKTRIVQIKSASSNILGQFSQERLSITVIFSIIEASARREIIANFDMKTAQGVNETRIVKFGSVSSSIMEPNYGVPFSTLF